MGLLDIDEPEPRTVDLPGAIPIKVEPGPIRVRTKIWNEHLRLTKINLLEVCRVSVAHDVARAIEKRHGPDFFVKQPVTEGANFVEYETLLYTFTPAEFQAFVAGLRAQWESEQDEK